MDSQNYQYDSNRLVYAPPENASAVPNFSTTSSQTSQVNSGLPTLSFPAPLAAGTAKSAAIFNRNIPTIASQSSNQSQMLQPNFSNTQASSHSAPPPATAAKTIDFAVQSSTGQIISIPTITKENALDMIKKDTYLNPDPRSPTKDSIVLQLCEAGRAEEIKIFIDDMKRKKIKKSHCNALGQTCLHKAVLSNSLPTVFAVMSKTLIDLKKAEDAAPIPGIGILLTEGARLAGNLARNAKNNSESQKDKGLINQLTHNKESPLHLAVMKRGQLDIVRALVCFGAEIQPEDLKIAIECGEFLTAYFLLLNKVEYKDLINLAILETVLPKTCQNLDEFLRFIKEEGEQISRLDNQKLKERAFKLKTVQAIMPYATLNSTKPHEKFHVACSGDSGLIKILLHRYETSWECAGSIAVTCIVTAVLQENPEIIDLLDSSKGFGQLLTRDAPELLIAAVKNLNVNITKKLLQFLRYEHTRIKYVISSKNNHPKFFAENQKRHYGPGTRFGGWDDQAVRPKHEAKLSEISSDGIPLIGHACLLGKDREADSLPDDIKIKRAYELINLLTKYGFHPQNSIAEFFHNIPWTTNQAIEEAKVGLTKNLLLHGAAEIYLPENTSPVDQNPNKFADICVAQIARQNNPALFDLLYKYPGLGGAMTYLAPSLLCLAAKNLMPNTVKKFLSLLMEEGTEITCDIQNKKQKQKQKQLQPNFHAFNRKKQPGPGGAGAMSGTKCNLKDITLYGTSILSLVCKLTSAVPMSDKTKIEHALEIIQMLLQAGFEPKDALVSLVMDRPNVYNQELADSRGKIAQLLVDAGADVNATDDKKNTVLTLARQKHYTAIEKILIGKGASEKK